MTLLLDTCVVSQLRKIQSGRAHRGVSEWAERIDSSSTYISCIALHELEIGVCRVERADTVAGHALRAWLETNVRPTFAGRILPVGEAVALQAAQLHVPDPRPTNDALIASTAIVHGMTLVTRNVRDFPGTMVSLFNPWEGHPL